MKIKLLTLLSIISIMPIGNVAAQTPQEGETLDGKTFYLYNTAQRAYVNVDNEGNLSLGSSGTPVTLTSAATRGGQYVMVTTNGTRLLAQVDGEVKAVAQSEDCSWKVQVKGEGYALACRMAENGVYGYMGWNVDENRLETTPLQPGDTYAEALWQLRSADTPATQEVVFTEDATTYTRPQTDGAVTVKLKTTLAIDQWNALCLPFALDQAALTTAFGNEVKVAVCTGDDEKALLFTSTQNVKAGQPCLIRPVKGAVEGYYEFYNITSFAAQPTDSKHSFYTLKGSFVQAELRQGYLIGNNYMVDFVTQPITMKAFSAVVSEEESRGMLQQWLLDGQGSGIADVEDMRRGNGSVYNLNGQKVAHENVDINLLPKGVYVVNGKKYVKQ